MQIIDPHIHMISRTTDDYRLMAETGIVAVGEPAFCPGTDRQHPQSHLDYFNHLTTFEPARAAKQGIRHWSFLGVHPKETENRQVAEAVLDEMDAYLDRPTVLGIGEIGLERGTENEIHLFRRQLERAAEREMLAIIHTPTGPEKRRAMEIIVDVILEVDPPRPLCLIDHCAPETLDLARQTGCWTALTVYPGRLSAEEAAALVRDAGTERMLLDSSADWDDSDPLATVATVGAMRQMALAESLIERLVWQNPQEFLGQNPKFTLLPVGDEP